VHQKLEPVGQERLKHEPHLLPISGALWFGFNVEAIATAPGDAKLYEERRAAQEAEMAARPAFDETEEAEVF